MQRSSFIEIFVYCIQKNIVDKKASNCLFIEQNALSSLIVIHTFVIFLQKKRNSQYG